MSTSTIEGVARALAPNAQEAEFTLYLFHISHPNPHTVRLRIPV
ncbi:hypothetical protein [Enterobacter asburiae]